MTTWQDVKRICEESFLVHDEADNRIEIEIAQDTKRSQKVAISQMQVASSTWIVMYSRFAKLEEANPEAILSLHSQLTDSIFGIQIRGDYYGLVFSMPMSDLDLNEFVEPLQLIVDRADDFEKIVTGKDRF